MNSHYGDATGLALSRNVAPVHLRGEQASEEVELIDSLLAANRFDRPLKELLQDALEKLIALSWFGLSSRGGIFLAEEGKEVLNLFVSHKLDEQIVKVCDQVEFGHCLCGRAAQNEQSVHASCFDDRHDTVFDGMKSYAKYSVPIKLSDEFIGVLVVYMPYGHQRDEKEIKVLERFSQTLGLIIWAHGRQEKLRFTNDQLTVAQSASDNILGAINQHTIVSQTTAHGVITDVNEAFCKISGYAKEELIGAPHSIVNSKVHNSEFWEDVWKTIKSGKAWRGEICNLAKDGSYYWVDTILMPLVGSDGKIERFISIRHDITNQMRAEDALSRMTHVLDYSQNEISVFDGDSLKFLLVNRCARDNLGYTSGEIQDMGPVDLIPDLTEERLRMQLDTLRAGKRAALKFETTQIRKDGSTYPAQVNIHYARYEKPPVFVSVARDITNRRRKDAAIKKLAYYDQLTGLANRTLLVECLASAMKTAEVTNEPLHMLIMDIDQFKEVNDTFGNELGDMFLQEVARRFEAALPAEHITARINGDEFVAIFPNISHTEFISAANALSTSFNTPLEVNGRTVQRAVNIGCVSYPDYGGDPEELLRYADIALCAAKLERSAIIEFEPYMALSLANRRKLKAHFIEALNNDGFRLAYQPFVEITSGRLTGAEVLLRWTDPEMGNISPADIIPIVEENRLMSPLGDWIINRTCRQMHDWTQAGVPLPDRISINVAVEQIEDGSVIDTIVNATKAYAIDPSRLSIEITENSMMSDTDRTLKVLADLKKLGVSVSIDDFGTGYSSLAYLKQFAVDKLKIDISFIRDLLQEKATEQIVTATIAMANGLGLDVLAEGIETEAQAKRVAELGCFEAQGYLYEKPLCAEEFAEKWLRAPGLRAG